MLPYASWFKDVNEVRSIRRHALSLDVTLCVFYINCPHPTMELGGSQGPWHFPEEQQSGRDLILPCLSFGEQQWQYKEALWIAIHVWMEDSKKTAREFVSSDLSPHA